MTRNQLSVQIRNIINEADFDVLAKVWAKDGKVAIFCKKVNNSKKGIMAEIGAVDVNFDGTIKVAPKIEFAFRYKPEVMAAIIALGSAEPEEKPEPAIRVRPTNGSDGGDSFDQMGASMGAIAARQNRSEIG